MVERQLKILKDIANNVSCENNISINDCISCCPLVDFCNIHLFSVSQTEKARKANDLLIKHKMMLL